MYAEELSQLQDITLHPEMPWAKCVYWLYSILINDMKSGINTKLAEKLEVNGVETRNFLYLLHEMPIYQKYATSKYPRSSKISEQGITLPSSVRLSEEDVKYIAGKIKENFSYYLKGSASGT